MHESEKLKGKSMKILLFYMMIFLMVGCSPKTQEMMSQNVERVTLTSVMPNSVANTIYQRSFEPQPIIEPPQIHQASMTAVGDLMFHEYQLKRSFDRATGSFNFYDTFTAVVPYLTKADLTIGNLETTLAGAYNSLSLGELPVAGYSGYPCFNTPDVVVGAIKEAGFDLLTTANNHSLDSGLEGLKRTLKVLDLNQIRHVGTYSTQEEADRIQIVEINGINFAFISMTYSINGFLVPEEAPYCINTLDYYSPEREAQMCQLVRDARTLNPDFIVVMPHYGTEYWEMPDRYQVDLSNALLTAGADLILGSHPHVLQPLEIKEVTREDGTTGMGFVAYSMGNFISSQRVERGIHMDLGVMINFDFEKIGDQKARILGFSLVPTYTYWSKDTIGVLPVDETLEQIDNNTLTLPQYDINRLKFAQTYSVKHLMTHLSGYEIAYKDYTYYVDLQEVDSSDFN